VDLHSPLFVVSHTQSARVWITQFYLQITPYLPLPRKRSPDGVTTDLWWRLSNCSWLGVLIYRLREDERLSWHSWLTYSWRFTHISGQPSAKRNVAHARNATQRLRTQRNPERTYARPTQRNAKSSFCTRKLLCLLLLRTIRRRRRRRHRFWIRDIFQLRKQKGEFELFCEMYDHDHETFYHNFRMSPAMFDLSLRKVGPMIEQEVKVIWQKAPHGGPIPRLGVTPGVEICTIEFLW